MAKIVVISGMSGAGRTVAAGALEDLGWFVIDNLPAALVSKVADLALSADAEYDRIALVAGGYDAEMSGQIEGLKEKVDEVLLLFLEASQEQLVRRFESTKRRHPLGEDRGLAEAIEVEREQLRKAREVADFIIDTSDLNPHELRDRISTRLADSESVGMNVSVVSFGFKHGLPRDVDLVFDCRFMPNPHWEEDLRPLTGQNSTIQEYVFSRQTSKEFFDKVSDMLTMLLPAYTAEGKSYLTISFGCTGGKHRSVAMAEKVADFLTSEGWKARVKHRDITS